MNSHDVRGICVHWVEFEPSVRVFATPAAYTHRNIHAKNKITLFCVKCLNPGSGRKIPAIWHGAGANPGVFIPET